MQNKVLWLMVTSFMLVPSFVAAIELNPSEAKFTSAITQGQSEATGEHTAKNLFGRMGYCGWGMLQTKLWSAWAHSYEASRKFKTVPQSEVENIRAQKGMIVTYNLCTDDPKRRDDTLIVLKQGEKVIQPSGVTVHHPEVITSRYAPARYSSTVQATFVYEEFDTQAPTTIIVVPYLGQRIQYEVRLADFE
jgi:hypothetical protein